jgi:hypothetical protein
VVSLFSDARLLPEDRRDNPGRYDMTRSVLIASLLCLLPITTAAEEALQGHTLVSPRNVGSSYLLDMEGVIVKAWHGTGYPASMAYMLPDSSILRPSVDFAGEFQAGGAGGRVQHIDANDVVVWDFFFSNADHQQHHDIEPMPGGNVLLIAWERKTRVEAEAWGRQDISGDMWPTLIVEVEPVGADGGTVVWEWHAWDHLIQDVDHGLPNYGVVAEHPELIDINYGDIDPLVGDWLHANAIDYHPQFDQIVFSSRSMNEFYVIDHSTTTQEAAGHTGGNSGKGGDILYRWGNPQVYDRGDTADQYYYVIHGANWIDDGLPGAGNILTFNNGDRPGYADDYSTVAEIVPPVDEFGHYTIGPVGPFGPDAPVWTHGGPGGYYGSPRQCGAFRLPNGNTLISLSEGGFIFEVTEAGVTVWEYYHGTNIPRSQRYWADCGGVDDAGRLAGAGLLRWVSGQPNPSRGLTRLCFELAEASRVEVEIFDISGRCVGKIASGDFAAGEHRLGWDGRDREGHDLSAGIYIACLRTPRETAVRKLVLTR